MPIIHNSPRRTIIVIDEDVGSVTVSMTRKRACRESEPELALDKAIVPDQESAFELVHQHFGMSDAELNALMRAT